MRIILVKNLLINQLRELIRSCQNLYPEKNTLCYCFTLPVFACLYMICMNLYGSHMTPSISSVPLPQCGDLPRIFWCCSRSPSSTLDLSHPKAHYHSPVSHTVLSSAGDMARNRKIQSLVLNTTAKWEDNLQSFYFFQKKISLLILCIWEHYSSLQTDQKRASH